MAKTSKALLAKSFKVPRDLRIACAASTFHAIRAVAHGSDAGVVLDARHVDKTDAAGLQALLAGRRALASAGKSTSWAGCSAHLRAAAALLGLTEALEISE